jgi:thiamine-monophosphate kinase
MPLGEFELISRYFNRRSSRGDVVLGVGDDAALLQVPPGKLLVAATDTLVEGRHFLSGTAPEAIGHQALAVNLSDMAAMGAEPAWALMSLSTPVADERWLEGFAEGLYSLAERYDVALVGGDTVRGPLVVTIEVLGFVEPGLALRRDGACPGDALYVSGWPGEAAAGLEILKSAQSSSAADASLSEPQRGLVHRFLHPEPRVALGRALRGRATSAMDVSDGLLGDLAKLCAASQCGARVDLDRLPVSPALLAAAGQQRAESLLLQGGDDYELLFTLPPDRADELESVLGDTCPVHRLGTIEPDRGLRGARHGVEEKLPGAGFDHFA